MEMFWHRTASIITEGFMTTIWGSEVTLQAILGRYRVKLGNLGH